MDSSLPIHLNERMRWVVSPEDTPHGDGQFVMYWMHNALRAHENPALDTAICLARQNGLPLLVYHGLSEEYPFASDRHHAFMLQGHRDVQRELTDRGIAATFHLQRHQRRGPYLRDLTRQASVLVTEEMPVQPLAGWLERLAARCTTPIAAVDCTCIAPVGLVEGGPHTRAFAFRKAAEQLHKDRVGEPYVEQKLDVSMFDLADLAKPTELDSLSLQDANLAELIGECRIDHTIAPVADTPGGSRAGYARWKTYLENGLRQYAKTRNDATKPTGVSRMSAYLHYGMVSPFRIAREAADAGADKFLDELLVWRELAFHFCFHRVEQIDTLSAVPQWARETLEEHAADPRHSDCSWETLARARSGRPLWDAAQRSLLKHGELHNNLRMTWGKAMIPWIKSPARALQLTLDLNHRFALDGRNPSSYGGVLWCFGQFDRPFQPENPVIGSIRPRCIEEHSKRLDVNHYVRSVDRPIADRLPKVAVIGAGVGGLIAARTLRDHGVEVTVFDKSRGVGGRLSTRRAGDDGQELRFDHGAQYFTARDARFCRLVNSWIHDGLVQPWLGRIVHIDQSGELLSEKTGTPRYVGIPDMNAVAKHLAVDLDLNLETQISRLQRGDERWTLQSEDGRSFGPYDVVLCNCPSHQTLPLIDGHTPLQREVEKVTMRPCWAMMVAAESLSGTDFDAAFVKESPISWISKNSAKPGRDTPESWVIHASSEWSEQHLEDSRESVRDALVPAFESLIGRSVKDPLYLQTHRWRYAIPEPSIDAECLFDATVGLGACGDWCGGNRVEAAFLSGSAAAGAILRHCTIDRPAYRAETVTQPRLFAS